jgi:hypothetical protein
MATLKQNDAFLDAVLPSPSDLLDDAIEWIKANLNPDDVFDEDEIVRFTNANKAIDDVYPDRTILDYVYGTFNPEDVFDTGQLAAWAEENGYTKVTEVTKVTEE